MVAEETLKMRSRHLLSAQTLAFQNWQFLSVGQPPCLFCAQDQVRVEGSLWNRWMRSEDELYDRGDWQCIEQELRARRLLT
jgi:hypothetical protein